MIVSLATEMEKHRAFASLRASGLLNGKVAIITGASRGIGAASARIFAASGAKVVLAARDAGAIATVRRIFSQREAKQSPCRQMLAIQCQWSVWSSRPLTFTVV
jgi:NAD(P)-dependent dehydrogenase (short-subunit alcohol dehydrogenase family)